MATRRVPSGSQAAPGLTSQRTAKVGIDPGDDLVSSAVPGGQSGPDFGESLGAVSEVEVKNRPRLCEQRPVPGEQRAQVRGIGESAQAAQRAQVFAEAAVFGYHRGAAAEHGITG